MQSDKTATPAKKTTTTTIKKAAPKAAPKAAVDKAAAAPKPTTPKKAAATKTTPKAATKKATATKAAAPKKTTKVAAKSTSTGKLKVRFEVFFSTKFGESMLISGAHPALGAEATDQAPVMEYINDQKWAINVELDKSSIKDGQLSYTYLLRYDDGALSLSAPYLLEIPATATSITVRDAWNAPGFVENAYGTDALQAIAAQTSFKSPAGTSKKKWTHRFMITAPPLETGKAICLLGEDQALGGWDPAKAIVLSNHHAGTWQVDLALKLSADPSFYKYGIYNLATDQLESFEDGDNRDLQSDPTSAALLILQNGFLRTN